MSAPVSPQPPSTTVLLATRNGGRLLRDVLQAYLDVEAPAGGWQLVIVDNGSTDETPSTIESYRGRLPLTALREPRAGKNRALNAGLSVVAGDLIVLTDDDTFPARDWLVEMSRCARAHPEVDVFAGRILPRWETPPAPWILDAVPQTAAYTLTGKRHVEGPISPELIFGPNMAVRRVIFQDGVRFDESIGPNGASYAMGSETELTLRLVGAGHRTWYCDQAVVEHYIRKQQLDRNWILNRAVRYGRGRFRLRTRTAVPPASTLLGVPLLSFKRVVGAVIEIGKTRLGRDSVAAFEAHWELRVAMGELSEAWLSRKTDR